MGGLDMLRAALEKAEIRIRDEESNMTTALRHGTRSQREAAECRVANANSDARALRRSIAIVERGGE